MIIGKTWLKYQVTITGGVPWLRIRATFASTSTLGKSLTHAKDSIPKDKASQLVYKLSRPNCTTVYIGEISG